MGRIIENDRKRRKGAVISTTTSQLEDVLTLVRQLTLADQAQLVVQIAPAIASALHSEKRTLSSGKLPPNSRAAQLAADPNSALAQVLSITGSGFQSPSDADVAHWREERLSERYGI